jgi:integrase
MGEQQGPYQANRTLALIRAMYNKADALGWKGDNPATGIERFPEKARDRFLLPEELPKFFAALVEEPNPVLQAFFLLCLLTGARRSNVEAMRWDEISWELAQWRIPDTKGGVPVVVPLVPAAIAVLKRLQETVKSEWVLPGRRGGHLTTPGIAWKRLLKRAGLEDLRIHDLRRSLGSWQALTGASLPIIGKSLGHSRPETTAIYARLTLDPVRQAVERATEAMMQAGGPTLIVKQSNPAPNTIDAKTTKNQLSRASTPPSRGSALRFP